MNDYETGNFYLNIKKYDEAIEYFEDLDVDEYPDLYFKLGFLYYHKGVNHYDNVDKNDYEIITNYFKKSVEYGYIQISSTSSYILRKYDSNNNIKWHHLAAMLWNDDGHKIRRSLGI